MGEIKLSVARFFLIRSDSALLREELKDIGNEKTPAAVAKVLRATGKEGRAEREKTLCMYHGFNV
ncbi:MAG: hypothetical protein P4M11_12605 [Candidatus Pacebacteria bacterium]|nr:hypothetical protein [Candidatus Paceibacterota bacterium]